MHLPELEHLRRKQRFLAHNPMTVTLYLLPEDLLLDQQPFVRLLLAFALQLRF